MARTLLRNAEERLKKNAASDAFCLQNKQNVIAHLKLHSWVGGAGACSRISFVWASADAAFAPTPLFSNSLTGAHRRIDPTNHVGRYLISTAAP